MKHFFTFYNIMKICLYLKELEIEPVITISHYETPLNLVLKYGGWLNREMISFFENYCKTIFTRYKGLVKYWMTFNEINNTHVIPFSAAAIAHDSSLEEKFIAAHYMFVASAIANKLCHEIDPAAKIGTMLSLSGVYPATCNPNDVFGAYNLIGQNKLNFEKNKLNISRQVISS